MKLHPLEKKVLSILERELEVEKLSLKADLKKDQIRKAIQLLEDKGLVKIHEKISKTAGLTELGRNYRRDLLPEVKLIRKLRRSVEFKDVKNISRLNEDEFGFAFGFLKRKGFVEKEGDELKLTKAGKRFLKSNTRQDLIEELPKNFEKLNRAEEELIKQLEKRGIVKIKKDKSRSVEITEKGAELKSKNKFKVRVGQLTPEIIREGTWSKRGLREYNIEADVGRESSGKKHFYKQVLNSVRKAWLEMGFKEMRGPSFVETAFWNLDALFVPQDHPAREMHDTFYTGEKGKVPEELFERVSKQHKEGWGRKVEREESRKLLLRTHTTCLSARTLASLEPEDLPVKYFAVGRSFRNETMDWTHLPEFYQTEGIVAGEGLTFKNLLGYLKTYVSKLGYEKARFRPGYFPFTEMSVEADVYDQRKGKWIELVGAGIFRPEVVKPLLGEEVPVLAWGPGIGRVITIAYKLKGIKSLYNDDLEFLKSKKEWMK